MEVRSGSSLVNMLACKLEGCELKSRDHQAATIGILKKSLKQFKPQPFSCLNEELVSCYG